MIRCFIISFICLSSVSIKAQPFSKAVPLYKKGQLLQQQGKFFEAISVYKKAITADRRFDSAHLALAALYLKTSQNDSAVQVLTTATKNKPAFAAAYELLGMAYRDYIKNSATALQHYKNAALYDSTNKTIWYSLAWCSNDLKQYKDAVAYAIKALDIDNNYRPAYNEMGHAFRNMQAYTEAIEAFRKRITISVNEMPLYYSGLCYIELKDKTGATNIYNELLKVNAKYAASLKQKIDSMP